MNCFCLISSTGVVYDLNPYHRGTKMVTLHEFVLTHVTISMKYSLLGPMDICEQTSPVIPPLSTSRHKLWWTNSGAISWFHWTLTRKTEVVEEKYL